VNEVSVVQDCSEQPWNCFHSLSMVSFYLRKCHHQNYKGKLRSYPMKFKVAVKETLERKSPFDFFPLMLRLFSEDPPAPFA